MNGSRDNRSDPRRAGRPRRGSMLVEVVVCAALLGALFVVIHRGVSAVYRQVRITDRAVVAQQTLENLLEEITSRDWSEIDADSIDALALPELVTQRLPGVVLAGEVVEEAEPVAAKRISLSLRWKNEQGLVGEPVGMTTWVYQKAGGGP